MEVTPFSKRFTHFQGGPVKKIILHTQATDISIHLNLLGPFSDDLRSIPILRDLSCHADALSLVLALWGTKFAPIAAPDTDREDLVGVPLIHIQERRLSPGCNCI